MSLERTTSESAVPPARRSHFGEDFRRFFLRGLAALMPTLITLWLLIKVWDFLWDSLGQYIIWFISIVWLNLVKWKVVHPIEPADIRCGGFTRNPHSCPADYTCHYDHVPDVPGTCQPAN